MVTFTLFGRWQIRLWLFMTIGLPIASAIALKLGISIAQQTLIILIYLSLFGLVWDAVYHQLQRWRWDGDWQGLLQLGGAIWEGIFLIAMIKLGLPGIDRLNFQIPGFIGFYSLFSVLNFTIGHSFIRILAPSARFNGGQWF